MAMPMPTTLHEVPEVAPHQVHPKREAAEARPRPRPRLTPDEEAMQLMMKVVERVEVAKSFAKIAAGLVSVSAARAGMQLRAVADAKMAEAVERDGGVLSQVDKVRKIARAAKDAALHVATHRPETESPQAADASIAASPAAGDAAPS